MTIWMFIFARIVFAQDLSTQEYCFTSNFRMKQVANRIKIVLLPADSLNFRQNCLLIQSSPHRSELIEKYISQIAPEVGMTFSLTQVEKNLCDLEIEKIISNKEMEENLNIQNNNNKQTQRTETSQIKTSGLFEFSYDQKQIKGNCRYVTNDHYELELEINPELKTTVQLKRGEKMEMEKVLKNMNNDKNETLFISIK